MVTTLIAFGFGLFMGGCVGFLIAGCFALEGRTDDMMEAKMTIDKQNELIRELRRETDQLKLEIDSLKYEDDLR